MSTYPYSYDELLYRLHTAKSADEVYKKINLPPLKIYRKNKTTIFANFGIYSEKLKRSEEHISNYFRAETNAGNSINGQNQLIIQAMLNETKCESIMRNYIKQFVMCRQCKGIDSILVKENGFTYLQCNQCLAKTSLGKI